MSRTRIVLASLSLGLAVLHTCVLPLHAQQGAGVPDSRHGTRVAPLLLLTRPDVQADLQLTPQQVSGAFQTLQQLSTRARSLKGQADTPATVAARREIDKAMSDWLAQTLSPEQQVRLRQLDLQWEGPTAIVSRGSVAMSLGITDQQHKPLEKLYLDILARRAKAQPTAELEQAFETKVGGVLTPTQKELWAAMLGPPLAHQVAQQPPANPTR